MASRGTAATPETLQQGFAETWGGVLEAVDGIDAAGWARETGCPGWTVQDCVAHIAALERRLLGAHDPDHHLPDGLPHVTDEVKRVMEMGVDYRRSWPPERVLAQFREATEDRLAALSTLTPEDLDAETQGLFGKQPLRGTLGIRLFDCWSHEQDIRRALQRPGGLAGVAAAHARENMVRGAAHALQQGIAPSAGTTVLLDITGASAARRAIGFDGSSGRRLEEEPAEPAVSLRTDLATLTVLCCGRHDDPGARERVAIEGDRELGGRLLDHLAFTP